MWLESIVSFLCPNGKDMPKQEDIAYFTEQCTNRYSWPSLGAFGGGLFEPNGPEGCFFLEEYMIWYYIILSLCQLQDMRNDMFMTANPVDACSPLATWHVFRLMEETCSMQSISGGFTIFDSFLELRARKHHVPRTPHRKRHSKKFY